MVLGVVTVSSFLLKYSSNFLSLAALASRVFFLSLNWSSASFLARSIRAAASLSAAPSFAAFPWTPPPLFCASTAATLAPAFAAAASTALLCISSFFFLSSSSLMAFSASILLFLAALTSSAVKVFLLAFFLPPLLFSLASSACSSFCLASTLRSLAALLLSCKVQASISISIFTSSALLGAMRINSLLMNLAISSLLVLGIILRTGAKGFSIVQTAKSYKKSRVSSSCLTFVTTQSFSVFIPGKR
mmetsp:Transcript_9374/g.19048  ORF Transcript_9374/g.19048 Transcript_9374/m.19048 type:complete len:246 (-) Transcript_9374:2297-3034(-)